MLMLIFLIRERNNIIQHSLLQDVLQRDPDDHITNHTPKKVNKIKYTVKGHIARKLNRTLHAAPCTAHFNQGLVLL